MKDDSVFKLAIGAIVVIVLMCIVTIGLMNMNNNDHYFDTSCLSVGKTIKWTTLQGDGDVYKECR